MISAGAVTAIGLGGALLHATACWPWIGLHVMVPDAMLPAAALPRVFGVAAWPLPSTRS